MYKNFAREHSQAGQTAVLFALMIIGLVAFIGLAVDGGNVFNGRRVAQNAVDGAAMAGVHYMFGTDAPTETRLQEVVNGVVESNGVGDTDGNPGNAVNDNVATYYTDDRGNRLTGCNEVGACGSIPPPASGLEVIVDHQVATYFLGVINRDTLGVGAEAVAVATGGSEGGGIGDNVLHAFGACSQSDKPVDISAHYIDFIGGVHSATWFENRGSEGGVTDPDSANHYHGQVTYGDGYGWVDTADAQGVYEPNPPGEPRPVETTPGEDPLADLFTVNDFNCTNGDIGTAPGVACYDMTQYDLDPYGGEINTRLLRDHGYLNGTELDSGLYYGGNYPFRFGVTEMNGDVTLVTSSTIKITENNVHLRSYLGHGTIIDGLLFYSTFDPGDPCGNFPFVTPPIDTTGDAEEGEVSVLPGVNHDADDGCVDLDQPSRCFRPGSLRYFGLLYAPNGRIATSGHGATYEGAIIAPSIRVNGYIEFENGRPQGDPYDEVGALFVRNPNLFPPTQQLISLER